jgi:hypothetical protein
MPRPKRQCAYCGGVPGSRDHIPPRNLFPNPPPDNLITVPSCISCNSGFKLDDDYFWQRISGRIEGDDQPSQCDAASRAIRHLSHANSAGNQTRFVRDVRIFQSDDGHEEMVYEVDRQRTERTVARIVQGLWFHVNKEPLPAEYVASARDLEMLPQSAVKEILAPLDPQPENHVGEVFAYKFLAATDDQYGSLWSLSFYNSSFYFGMTRTRESA